MGFVFDKLNLLILTVFLIWGLCIHTRSLIPKEYYHESLIEFKQNYQTYFKDPFFAKNAPHWVEVIIFLSIFTGIPYYLVAIFAFAKGNCSCIRVPSIIYATETLTGFVLLLDHLWRLPLEGPGVHPKTPEEFYKLFGVYSVLFLYHLIFLIYFLRNPNYGSEPAVTTSQATRKAKKN